MKKIPLTQNKSATVDLSAFQKFGGQKWYTKNGYAARSIPGGTVFLHREIMGLGAFESDKTVDHINNDRLDNRRSNLRVVSKGKNSQKKLIRSDSTSGFKGVSFSTRLNKWQSYICKDGKQTYLGLHTSKHLAARAYDKAAREMFGPIHAFNFK